LTRLIPEITVDLATPTRKQGQEEVQAVSLPRLRFLVRVVNSENSSAIRQMDDAVPLAIQTEAALHRPSSTVFDAADGVQPLANKFDALVKVIDKLAEVRFISISGFNVIM